ncbi:MAG: LemA family protein [Sphingobacteriales bacterium]|nr:LemA family protein [Sphingobacteriales bacterium]
MTSLIILGIIVLLVLWVVGMYNRLVRFRNQVSESWSGIDVQLKRRYDLIPNLVNTVKGYAAHESATLERVIQARNAAASVRSGDIAGAVAAEKQLGGALRQLFAIAESYPDLKANTSFIQLQNTLAQTEDEISRSRRYYNAVVRDYNTSTETFPSVFIANAFGFKKAEYFEIEDPAERQNVQVQF